MTGNARWVKAITDLLAPVERLTRAIDNISQETDRGINLDADLKTLNDAITTAHGRVAQLFDRDGEKYRRETVELWADDLVACAGPLGRFGRLMKRLLREAEAWRMVEEAQGNATADLYNHPDFDNADYDREVLEAFNTARAHAQGRRR